MPESSFTWVAVCGYFLLMAWAVIGRIGLGFVLPALSLGAMRGVDPALLAQGASTISFLRLHYSICAGKWVIRQRSMPARKSV